MNVQVTHANAMCIVAYPIPLAPLTSFQIIRVGMTLHSLVVTRRKSHHGVDTSMVLSYTDGNSRYSN